jgi:hypothetical protein
MLVEESRVVSTALKALIAVVDAKAKSLHRQYAGIGDPAQYRGVRYEDVESYRITRTFQQWHGKKYIPTHLDFERLAIIVLYPEWIDHENVTPTIAELRAIEQKYISSRWKPRQKNRDGSVKRKAHA